MAIHPLHKQKFEDALADELLGAFGLGRDVDMPLHEAIDAMRPQAREIMQGLEDEWTIELAVEHTPDHKIEPHPFASVDAGAKCKVCYRTYQAGEHL